MSQKLGRPILETSDVRVRRRRAQDAECRRQLIARNRLRRAEQGAEAAAVQPTPAQLQQGETIIDFAQNNQDIDPTIAAFTATCTRYDINTGF